MYTYLFIFASLRTACFLSCTFPSDTSASCCLFCLAANRTKSGVSFMLRVLTAVLFSAIMSTKNLCFLLVVTESAWGCVFRYLNLDKCRFPLCCTLKSCVVCLDIDVKKALRNELQCIFYCRLLALTFSHNVLERVGSQENLSIITCSLFLAFRRCFRRSMRVTPWRPGPSVQQAGWQCL